MIVIVRTAATPFSCHLQTEANSLILIKGEAKRRIAELGKGRHVKLEPDFPEILRFTEHIAKADPKHSI
jgi:hypothetical protein